MSRFWSRREIGKLILSLKDLTKRFRRMDDVLPQYRMLSELVDQPSKLDLTAEVAGEVMGAINSFDNLLNDILLDLESSMDQLRDHIDRIV